MARTTIAHILSIAMLASACSGPASPPGDPANRIPSSTVETSAVETPSTRAAASPGGSAATMSTVPPPSQPEVLQPPADVATCEAPVIFNDVESEVWDSELIGFDRAGSPLWRMALPDGDRYSAEPVLGSVMVSGSMGGGLALVDPSTCAVRWQLSTGSFPHVAESEVSFVYVDGQNLSRVDQDFVELWTTTVEPATDLAVLGELLVLTRAGAFEMRLLSDGTVHHSESLAVSTSDTAVAATADTDGFLVRANTLLVKADVVGQVEWTHRAPGRVFSAAVVGDAVAVLEIEHLTLLDLATGAERWSHDIPPTTDGPLFEHDEIHLLTTEGRLLHFGLDGALVFDGDHRSDRTHAEFDDGLVIETDRGRVTAYTMLEQQVWSIVTGADGIGRLTTLDVQGETILALTFNVEQG